MSVLEVANIYEQYSGVTFAVPNFWVPIEPASLPSDPYFFAQYNFHYTHQPPAFGVNDADIDAPEAWDFGLGDTSIVVAVIDKGVEAHEDLPAERLTPGWDFAGHRVTLAADDDNDPSPGDCCDCVHGMQCAGLIAAAHNEVGIAGLAPNSMIMPIKIWDDDGIGVKLDLIDSSIIYAYKQGADIINCSWNFVDMPDIANLLIIPDSIKLAIQMISDSVLIVFSAGNQGNYVHFPANLKEVLAVGASDKHDWRSNYSPQYLYAGGDSLDLVAPSSMGSPNVPDVWTLHMMGLGGDTCTTIDPPASENYSTRFGGTSASCPQVAGVAALLMSYAKKSYGRLQLTTNDYKAILKLSTDDLGPAGWDPEFGHGRLNALKALVAIARGDANKDATITAADTRAVINHVFNGIPLDTPALGDADCGGGVTAADVIYLVNYIFKGGPAPLICYEYDY